MKKKLENGDNVYSPLKKLLLIMKLSTFILLLSFIHVSASVYSQSTRVSLKMQNTTIAQVFDQIENQTEFYFFYNRNEFNDKEKVSVDFTNKKIKEILDVMLANKSLVYEIRGRNIIITKLEESQLNFGLQSKSISGQVADDSGQALPGVTVIIKGTTQGTITDNNGNYSLSNVPSDATLVFSFVGMKTQEIQVNGKVAIDVTLIAETIGIDEVVAIGYGTVKKIDLTGAVSSISSTDIEKKASTNLTQVLRGSIAGMNVTLSSSAKGTGSILIRGKTSLKANNSPLIVVDGMIYDGDMADINTADVESIDILKDASSAAVYGARAASGVIILTTKKGAKGKKPLINVSSSVGFSKVQYVQEAFDPEGYLDLRMDFWETNRTEMPLGYFRNPSELPAGLSLEQWRAYDGDSPLSNEELWFSRNKLNEVELNNYRNGQTIDWYDEIFRVGLRQDHNVSIAGTTDNSSYYYSLGFVNNEGFLEDEKYENFRSRFNLESKINDFIKVGINTQFSRRDESSQYPNITLAMASSPYGSKYNEDGTYKLYPHDDNYYANPFYYRINDKYNVTNELLGNLYAEIKLPLGFEYRCNWVNRIHWSSYYYFGYSTNEATGSGGSRTDYNYRQWYVDNIITWKKTIADIHRIDFTFLYNAEKENLWKTASSNSTFLPSEMLGYHQLSFGTNPQVSNNDEQITGDALMARLNYSLMDKYLFTAAFRRDGYSIFGEKNPWGYFPSGAFAWRLSEENFFNVPWIDNLKLRVSYGINGNRDIDNYLALAYLAPIKYIYQTDDGKQSFSGYYSSRMSNSNLQWEETAAWNTGIDFSILNGRFSGTIEGYKMSTKNLILDRSLPIMTGYSSITTNLGEVENKGIELSLNSINLQRENFIWESQFLLSLNRNKIKHLYGDMVEVTDESGNVIGMEEASDYSNKWFIGEDIDRIYDYELGGIWQLDEENEASNFGLQPGDFRVVDQNDDGKISSREDKKFLGYSTPRYRMSLINNFTILKNFYVSFLFNAQLGFWGVNNEHFRSGFEYSRMNRYKYPYWTADNPLNDFARLDSNNPYSASYYVNRSFVKLQDFSIGYTVPSRLLKPYKIEALKLSFNLQNSLCFTGWDFWDPELKERKDPDYPEEKEATPMLGTFKINITL